MLPKKNRLIKNQDFDRVFKKGKGLKEGFLFLKILKNDLEISRFGFVVSNKVSNKATVRNKIKRKLRNLVREKLSKIQKGMDVVVVVNPGFQMEKLGPVDKIVDILLLKANLL